jgi:hypothetical protein
MEVLLLDGPFAGMLEKASERRIEMKQSVAEARRRCVVRFYIVSNSGCPATQAKNLIYPGGFSSFTMLLFTGRHKPVFERRRRYPAPSLPRLAIIPPELPIVRLI